jgi:flagellar biosynthesis/type III secretory pathway ATPase
MTLELDQHIEALDWLSSVEVRGRVTELVGLLIRAAVPGVRVGEVCLIRSPHSARELRAEVVGFRGSEVILMPLGDIQDVAMGAEVVSTAAAPSRRRRSVPSRRARASRRRSSANCPACSSAPATLSAARSRPSTPCSSRATT